MGWNEQHYTTLQVSDTLHQCVCSYQLHLGWGDLLRWAMHNYSTDGWGSMRWKWFEIEMLQRLIGYSEDHFRVQISSNQVSPIASSHPQFGEPPRYFSIMMGNNSRQNYSKSTRTQDSQLGSNRHPVRKNMTSRVVLVVRKSGQGWELHPELQQLRPCRRK